MCLSAEFVVNILINGRPDLITCFAVYQRVEQNKQLIVLNQHISLQPELQTFLTPHIIDNSFPHHNIFFFVQKNNV